MSIGVQLQVERSSCQILISLMLKAMKNFSLKFTQLNL